MIDKAEPSFRPRSRSSVVYLGTLIADSVKLMNTDVYNPKFLSNNGLFLMALPITDCKEKCFGFSLYNLHPVFKLVV